MASYDIIIKAFLLCEEMFEVGRLALEAEFFEHKFEIDSRDESIWEEIEHFEAFDDFVVVLFELQIMKIRYIVDF